MNLKGEIAPLSFAPEDVTVNICLEVTAQRIRTVGLEQVCITDGAPCVKDATIQIARDTLITAQGESKFATNGTHSLTSDSGRFRVGTKTG